MTQGYLTYTCFVVDPANDGGHKVIIDAGNGQVLYTSEVEQMGFGDNNGGFGSFGHGFGSFGHGPFGFAPWSTSGGFMGAGDIWH